jgi:hypothetical protein
MYSVFYSNLQVLYSSPVRLYFSQMSLVPHIHFVFFFFISVDMFQGICRLMHFINNTSNTFKASPKLLKIYWITGRPNSELLQEGESKVFPVHAMKAFMGSRGIAPLIQNLGPCWFFAVSVTPPPPPPGLLSLQEEPWYLLYRMRLGRRRAGLYILEKTYLAPTGIRTLHLLAHCIVGIAIPTLLFQLSCTPRRFFIWWSANLTEMLPVHQTVTCTEIPSPFRIKMFELCEPGSCYLWFFLVCTAAKLYPITCHKGTRGSRGIALLFL